MYKRQRRSFWNSRSTNIHEIRETLHSKDPVQRAQARASFLQYVDKVICAHYDNRFVVNHECRKGTVSGPAADLFQEVDVNTYREARHKDACLQHKGRLMFCPECKQRFSPEEIIRATRSRIQNSVRGDGNLKEQTAGHDKELPKAWMDIAALRYPYTFDVNGCTIEDK